MLHLNKFSTLLNDQQNKYIITVADKIMPNISYIGAVSKKKATIEKILAHLSKSEISDKTWSTESLKELLSDMTAKD